MLVSDQARICFIHIHRTGGSSIAELLSSALPDARQVCFQHDNAKTIAPADLERYKGYFKFAFVRNPWERILSWYALAYQYRLDRETPFVSLDTFIEEYETVRRKLRFDNSFMFNQFDYLSAGNGGVAVDVVGRFEDYENELLRILDRCGVPPREIPRLNATQHGSVREAYSGKGRALVEALCRRDIEYWSYRFG